MCPIIKSELREKLRAEFIACRLCPDGFSILDHDDVLYLVCNQTVNGHQIVTQSPFFRVRDGATYADLIVREMRRDFEHRIRDHGWRPPQGP